MLFFLQNKGLEFFFYMQEVQYIGKDNYQEHLSILCSPNTTFTEPHKLSVPVVRNPHAPSPAPILPGAHAGACNKEFNALPAKSVTDIPRDNTLRQLFLYF